MESDVNIFDNPFVSVKPNGILCFGLGDNKDNVCQRIKSLGFDAENYEDIIIIKDGRLNGIIKIQLDFGPHNALDLITVYIQLQIDLKQLVNLIAVCLNRPPTLSSLSMHTWRCDNGCNINLINSTDFNSSNTIELSFGYN